MKGSSLLSFLALFTILLWIVDEYFIYSFLKEKSFSLEKRSQNSFNKNILKGLTSNSDKCFFINETRLCLVQEKYLFSTKNIPQETCSEILPSPQISLSLTSKYTCSQVSFSDSKIVTGNIHQNKVAFDRLLTIGVTGYFSTKILTTTQQGGILIAHGDIIIESIDSRNLTLISTSGSIEVRSSLRAENFSAFAKKISLPRTVTNQKIKPTSTLVKFLLSASPKDS